MMILGISAYYHDSAAVALRDGEIIAAAQEERFTRKKHDAGFPENAVRYCLREAGTPLEQFDAVVFYDKPLLKFERLLETYLAFAPRGLWSFTAAMPVWIKEKLFLKEVLKTNLSGIAGLKRKSGLPPLLFAEHHQSHAASAFYPSPFESAAVLCLDGVGEWTTTSAWTGRGRSMQPLWEIQFPHSLGLLYSAFTYYTGFKVNSGEYKVMGLAPYGRPVYTRKIYDEIIDVKPDGTYRLNLAYFNFCIGSTMTSPRFHDLFGGPPRKPEDVLTQKEMDLARSIQEVTEEIMLRLARTLRSETGERNLCLAGGLALNCVGNGKILREGIFDRIWIQPAAGDAGGALGAALVTWHDYFEKDRAQGTAGDSMKGSLLGPKYSNEEIEAYLRSIGAPYHRVDGDELYDRVGEMLSQEQVVGFFQGRMEFGPRALGCRSIVGDARSPRMQSVMNLKIKYRESFRPFAPAVLRERVHEYFELDCDSPYMLLVAPVVESRRMAMSKEQEGLWGIERLNVPKSDIPAVTHLDYSARVQTVHAEKNPGFYKMIKAFESRTGCGVIVNTSFNVRGEPIVGSPADAYRCFMRTEMDALVLENCLLFKSQQPELKGDTDWRKEFELD